MSHRFLSASVAALTALLLPSIATAAYVSPVAEYPSPILKQGPDTWLHFGSTGLNIGNMVMIRQSPGQAIPPVGVSASCSSFFDIFCEVSMPGSTVPSSSFHCDSFFDIFTEISGGAQGAGGAQGCSSLNGMLQPPGVMIRESPTRSSTGRFSAAPGPGGYTIDSFFDIWVEISLDGGGTWIASDESVRMTGTPEPAALSMLAIAGVGLLRRRH